MLNNREEIDQSIMEQFANLSSFSKRETFLLENKDKINLATLESLHDNETDDEMADFIKIMINDH